MNWKNLKRFSPLLVLAIFLLALVALSRALGEYRFSDILGQLAAFPPSQIMRAAALTGICYLVLTLYDHLAVRYLGRSLPSGRITLASFTSYAFSRNVGLSLLTGGSIRYRLYSSWGLSAEEVARLTAFTALSFSLGLATMGGSVLLFSRESLPELPQLPPEILPPLGGVALAAVAGYLLLTTFRRQPFRLRGWLLPLPAPRHALGQILIGSIDWTLTASVLYLLLPASATLSLPHFLQIYLLAQLAVMLSHVPGGLGVFESVILLLVPGLPAPALFGSLLVYRAVYFLVPFGLSLLLLGAFEILQPRGIFRRAGAALGQWLSAFAPALLAAAALAAGAALLISGAIPEDAERLRRLESFLPLPLLELSHFLAAIAGTGLLLLAPGLLHRLRSASLLTLTLVSGGLMLAFLRLEAETAMVLVPVLVVLAAGRSHFDRRGSLLEEPFPPGWVAAILIVFSASAWLGIFSFRLLELTPRMWWSFDFEAEASRYLRAQTGAALTLLLFAAAKRRYRPFSRPQPPASQEMEKVERILARNGSSFAPLTLPGQKLLLLSRENEAFLLYGISGRAWVAWGDPIGPAQQRRELAWRFREVSERGGGWPVFYGVGEEDLPSYLDLGLSLQKIGEAAKVPLDHDLSPAEEFDPGLRRRWEQLLAEGCRLEIVQPVDIPVLLPEFRKILEEWREFEGGKRGNFRRREIQAEDLRRFPAAVVRWDGEVVAFAALRPDTARGELHVGPLRQTAVAPGGVLEFLLCGVMLWGQKEGYRWLSLGLTPLVAGAADPFEPTWRRFGRLLFDFGEHFDELEGLREFKERFRPRWEARYLACPDGADLPEIFAEVAALAAAGGKAKAEPAVPPF